MSYDVELTTQAEADLRGIFDYIAFQLQSLQNAAGQLARLEKSIFSLDEMPDRYRRYDREPWRSRGMRIMPVDNYCVFYITDHERGLVQITRVMYGGKDIAAELSKSDGAEES
ncbi:MAG: type II toxin-antitoxin system RelE/ParE family toxin [Clostridiales bacterium]|nr:type II toxin-antitoxin system RelE/ParE family toxin [Clostridiales bacterium]